MVSTGRLIAIICGLIMSIACICYIVSNAVPLWGSKTIESVSSTVGLWRACISIENGTSCGNLPLSCSREQPEAYPVCQKMMISRAFITISCIISALSAICLFAYAIIRTDFNRIVMIISKILPLVSFIAGIIGVIVGNLYVTAPPFEYKIDVAAIIGITAVAINAIGAVFALMIR